MMLGRLFGRRDDAAPAPPPAHPCGLAAGGFLKLGLAAPEGLAGAELQVVGVHALDFGHEVRRVLAVEAAGSDRFEMWRGEAGRIAFARLADRPDVARLFDLDRFARLFDPEEPANLALSRRAEPPGFGGWTAPVYRQEAAREAWRHDSDPDAAAVGRELDDGARGFDFYLLVGDRRRRAVEARVHDGGRTEVALVAMLPGSAVEEIWPG